VATNPTPQQHDVLTIERPEQLKALGHPLRLKVLQTLGEHEDPLTNRELAAKLGVDPGHLHFHVRMLHKAGLIELAETGRGREKPYRAVAAHVRVSPEIRAAGLAGEVQAAMLAEIQRGWEAYGAEGEFRSAQINVRINPEQLRELLNVMVERAEALEDTKQPLMVVTLVAHPATQSPEDNESADDSAAPDDASSEASPPATTPS
jgi:DNA-binding transcriptional ArsR family regulator